MGKAKFILKEPKAKEETLVYLFYNYQYKRFKYSTGEKINPKYWNPNSQRAKESKQFREHPEFNSRLDNFERGIASAFRKLLNDGVQPNNTILKKELEAVLSGNILQPNKLNLFDFIERFIEESKLIKKEGTVKVYKTSFKYLQKFASHLRTNIDFESVTLDFYNQYIHFLSTKHNLSANTVGKHIKTLKTFMSEATERGLNDNYEFKKNKFKTLREEADTVYLSVEELNLIEKLDLSSTPRLERVKDLFLVGCYTGLRFSDFTQINPENIVESKSLMQVRTQKTGERVFIPLHRVVKKILKKYDNRLPQTYTNQVMNRYIKEVCCIAGIKEELETTITKGGKLTKTPEKKFNLISTHTARRSFATNLYLADVPSISIMKITGHKSEKSFLKYIRVTQEQNADKLLNHPFFQ
ncbi:MULTISPECIES: site-specific integrase [unclassified Leeuwenhoekiella]|uniref:site-specific integrase n=1 Tax=unclassified Leeuwenhoekiella TaxID=2615029 RepID=UPI000C6AEE10|nr:MULTISPECIES: site-specific integrase [unclassified Leeuwenhoekiella]MAW95958.1 tyrosine type site-specific recombinase [Leeuwenhoekiella sp.]MBA79952.1 tyrosine type site-specific recombinase [Leeuwenhoekiella sp.]|tara:strand:- start:8859 stop:10094 length:1236 start_codon:yes stop_codon:yes gene_type:complete